MTQAKNYYFVSISCFHTYSKNDNCFFFNPFFFLEPVNVKCCTETIKSIVPVFGTHAFPIELFSSMNTRYQNGLNFKIGHRHCHAINDYD